MFGTMIIHLTTVVLVFLSQYHTHLMLVTGIAHVTETTVVIEAEVNHQDVTVTEMVIVRVAIRFNARPVDHLAFDGTVPTQQESISNQDKFSRHWHT